MWAQRWNMLLYVALDVKLKMGSGRSRVCWFYLQNRCLCMGCISEPHANVVTFWQCFRLDLDQPDPIFVIYLRSGSNAVSASHLNGIDR
jgi:hypothetical protein